MKLSRTAVLAPVPGRDQVLMVQPLTGQAALLDAATAAALRALEAGGPVPSSAPEETLRAAGFAVDGPEDDRALETRAHAAFLEEAARTPTQLVVVPSFGCNLACTYCYQEPFDPSGGGLISEAAVDAFFAHVDRVHGEERPRPYITLFGGEPLRDTPASHDRVGRFLDGAAARGMALAAVTNGYDLVSFVPRLSQGPVREIQVTLDGPPAVHDRRRPHVTGAPTFERVADGIDALVAASIPVNLRVVVDKENLPSLPGLAAHAERRGWLSLPESRFMTQVGRNYELFGCASGQRRDALFDRVELWAAFVELAEANPVLGRFHRPRFHGIAHLAETGELPLANFDACPAAKKEWAFSPDGGIYGCTATVGHPRHRLGSFYPSHALDEAAIAPWRNRSVLTIPACRACAHATVCGGGCGALADRRDGTPLAPDCRPVPELYGLGVRHYGLGA